MPLTPEERARILGDPTPPEQPREMRTCDCPIVFPENPAMASQVHRYDCPLGREMSLAAIRKRFETGAWDSKDCQWLYAKGEQHAEMRRALLYAPSPPGTFISVEGANEWLGRYHAWFDELREQAIEKSGDEHVSK